VRLDELGQLKCAVTIRNRIRDLQVVTQAVTVLTATVSGQRLGKHVPLARQQILNNATVETGCFLCGSCRDIISKGQGQLSVSSAREAVREDGNG
jgi:hypothetical protein